MRFLLNGRNGGPDQMVPVIDLLRTQHNVQTTRPRLVSDPKQLTRRTEADQTNSPAYITVRATRKDNSCREFLKRDRTETQTAYNQYGICRVVRYES